MAIGSEIQTHIGTRVGRSIYHPTWYVAELPGHDGSKRVKGSKSDWGWTTDRSKAIELSPYWQRRFLADRRRCGREARIED